MDILVKIKSKEQVIICLNEKEERMKESQWILCPICNNKTRIKVREDTELKNFPLYCPKCKKESLIEVKKLKTKEIRESKKYIQS